MLEDGKDVELGDRDCLAERDLERLAGYQLSRDAFGGKLAMRRPLPVRISFRVLGDDRPSTTQQTCDRTAVAGLYVVRAEGRRHISADRSVSNEEFLSVR